MSKRNYFSKTGDDGTTGLLGSARVMKSDLRMEALGALDEASAALGLGKSFARTDRTRAILGQIQRSLYQLMTEVAAVPESAGQFPSVSDQEVANLEALTTELGEQVQMPADFILPGDSPAAAAIDLGRTIVRRAERRVVELHLRGDLINKHLTAFVNRLSSLLFVLELYELQQGANLSKPTLAKDQ